MSKKCFKCIACMIEEKKTGQKEIKDDTFAASHNENMYGLFDVKTTIKMVHVLNVCKEKNVLILKVCHSHMGPLMLLPFQCQGFIFYENFLPTVFVLFILTLSFARCWLYEGK